MMAAVWSIWHITLSDTFDEVQITGIHGRKWTRYPTILVNPSHLLGGWTHLAHIIYLIPILTARTKIEKIYFGIEKFYPFLFSYWSHSSKQQNTHYLHLSLCRCWWLFYCNPSMVVLRSVICHKFVEWFFNHILGSNKQINNMQRYFFKNTLCTV